MYRTLYTRGDLNKKTESAIRKPTRPVEDDVETSLEIDEVMPESVQVEAILDVASVYLAEHTLALRLEKRHKAFVTPCRI